MFRCSYPTLRDYLSYVINTVPHFTRTFFLVLLWISDRIPLSVRPWRAQQPGSSQLIVIKMTNCLGYHLEPPNICVQTLYTDTKCAESETSRIRYPPCSHTKAAGIQHPEVQSNRQLLSMLDSKVCLSCDRLGSTPLFAKYRSLSSLRN